MEPPHIGHYREYPRALLYNYIVCIFVPLNLGVHGDAASVYFFMAVTCTESASIQKLVFFLCKIISVMTAIIFIGLNMYNYMHYYFVALG